MDFAFDLKEISILIGMVIALFGFDARQRKKITDITEWRTDVKRDIEFLRIDNKRHNDRLVELDKRDDSIVQSLGKLEVGQMELSTKIDALGGRLNRSGINGKH